MNKLYTIDTHALFWYLINSPKLSLEARRIFEQAFSGEVTLLLSPIVLLELYGLAQKVNAPFDFMAELGLFECPPFQIEPVTVEDLRLLNRLQMIPELHDRLIAATAFRFNAPLVTCDALITACADITSAW
jgi:PIN domain nuclease of toxin-antitoxin system